MKKISLLFLCLFSLLFLGCGKQFSKRISLGVVSGWAEGEAVTAVAQEILTQKGYHVVLQKAAANLLFASMNNGDTDAYMDVWLPTTHGDKVALFDKIKSAGVLYENALTGLVVPDYVPVNSIEELNAHKDQFDGKIIGIERGSGISASTDKAIEEYQLDFEQLNSSTVAMVAELQKALNEKRWIVITGWKPHWIFGRFDLKFLEDPKVAYGEAERLEVYVRQDLNEEFPEVYRFLQHVYLDNETMADLLAQMQESTDKHKTAQQWVQDHPDLVQKWWGK